MSLDQSNIYQASLLEAVGFRTITEIERNHPLIQLCEQIPWAELADAVIPILYYDAGIPMNKGRKLNLRAQLGAYILQSAHNWTDRWTEEMLKFYIPARIFCGYMESNGSLDRTSIEDFRNRLGVKGSALITSEILKTARDFGFTESTVLNMDTTVQEAGITHPTEMKLMNHLMNRCGALGEKLKDIPGHCLTGIEKLKKKFQDAMNHYRFFAKDKEQKSESIKAAKEIAIQALSKLQKLLPGTRVFRDMKINYQQEVLRLLDLGPRLMEQIEYWLKTGYVARDKIISLWKMIPQAVSKGKIGKEVEFGRKWIVNQYKNGYVLVMPMENPKGSDQHSIKDCLGLHHTVFEKPPRDIATDRGMFSQENLEICMSAEIKNIGIQTKGQSKSICTKPVLQRLSHGRISVEAGIGHLKPRGLGRSRMKTDHGDIISGQRSALSLNLTHLMKDIGFGMVTGR